MSARGERATSFDLRALPIAAKIALGLAAVLLVSSLITGSLVRGVVEAGQVEVVSNELESLSRAQAFRAADALQQQMDALSRLGQYDTIQAQLRMIADRPAQEAQAETAAVQGSALMLQQVQPFKLAHPEFDVVVLLDVWGHVLASHPSAYQDSLPEAGGWDWFSTVLSRGGTHLSGPRDDGLTTFQGVHIAAPVYDATSPRRLIGVVYGVWNMGNLPDVGQVRGREALIVQPDGVVVLAASEPRGSRLDEPLVAELGRAGSGTFRYTDPDGRQWLVGYTRLDELGLRDRTISGLGWIVAAREPLASAQADSAVLAGRVLVAVGLSAALVTLAIGALAFAITRPLRRLTHAAGQISAGYLDTPIPLLPRDEVGTLADALRGLVGRLVERVRQLNSTVHVSRVAVSSLEAGQIAENAAQAVVREFGYPAALIYLADAGLRLARLQALAGTPHEAIPRGHSLPVDERSAPGRAILLGEPQTGEAREVVLPLRVAGRSLGALAVYGVDGRAFEREEVDILSLVADQISASLENARLFEQSAANLAEIEALNRRLTRQAWEEYLETGGTLRHTLDPEGRWPGALESLGQGIEVTAKATIDADGRSVLAAPLLLRGEPVGALAVSRPPGDPWTRDERLLLEAVASRLAMVAEGIRLVEESSWRAEREQRVNEVSASLLQRAASVDGVLRTALNQLSGALGSDHVSLRIGRPPIDDEHQIEAGQGDPDGRGNGQGGSNDGG